MTRVTMAFMVLVALAKLPAPAAAQESEEAAVMAVVEAMFDAMRAGDSAAMRTVLHPTATGASV